MRFDRKEDDHWQVERLLIRLVMALIISLSMSIATTLRPANSKPSRSPPEPPQGINAQVLGRTDFLAKS